VFRGEINPRGIEEEQTTEAMRKRKSGQCQEVKTWEKQAPDTPTTEGNQTSREARTPLKKVVARGERRPSSQVL
jgi:hypothetical protein